MNVHINIISVNVMIVYFLACCGKQNRFCIPHNFSNDEFTLSSPRKSTIIMVLKHCLLLLHYRNMEKLIIQITLLLFRLILCQFLLDTVCYEANQFGSRKKVSTRKSCRFAQYYISTSTKSTNIYIPFLRHQTQNTKGNYS